MVQVLTVLMVVLAVNEILKTVIPTPGTGEMAVMPAMLGMEMMVLMGLPGLIM